MWEEILKEDAEQRLKLFKITDEDRLSFLKDMSNLICNGCKKKIKVSDFRIELSSNVKTYYFTFECGHGDICCFINENIGIGEGIRLKQTNGGYYFKDQFDYFYEKYKNDPENLKDENANINNNKIVSLIMAHSYIEIHMHNILRFIIGKEFRGENIILKLWENKEYLHIFNKDNNKSKFFNFIKLISFNNNEDLKKNILDFEKEYHKLSILRNNILHGHDISRITEISEASYSVDRSKAASSIDDYTFESLNLVVQKWNNFIDYIYENNILKKDYSTNNEIEGHLKLKYFNL